MVRGRVCEVRMHDIDVASLERENVFFNAGTQKCTDHAV